MNLCDDTRIGATPLDAGRCRFLVYAPHAEQVAVRLVSPRERLVGLARGEGGYHEGVVEDVPAGSRYFFVLDGTTERPDPASRFQPLGVHGPSEVVDPAAFAWEDGDWRGIALEEQIQYELHVGTFTAAGTFDAVIPHLGTLRRLGVNALEIMPVAQFPGSRNWGYDGVYPFAVQQSYGGPEGFRRLVNAAHRQGMAVILDVVYNHLGPEGNYLRDFGPYFTDRYRTPWGAALNFDGPESDEVRRFFVENALCWFTDYHLDALRLDAIHGITDTSAYPFLAELADAVRGLESRSGRRLLLIPESDLNDARIVAPRDRGGFGLDAQWSDDFHHALHTVLTGERVGYYEDFGALSQLAKAYREGYVYSGEYSPHRRRRHGNSSRGIPAAKLVVCSQNHDQVGNRLGGERLGALVPFEALKVAAGAVLLSPFVPLLFMGEEYGEPAPFQYFVSHGDPELIAAVREGRKREFAAFHREGETPDPQDEQTFARCRLDHGLRRRGHHRLLHDFYQELIRLRRAEPVLRHLGKQTLEATAFDAERVLLLRRWQRADQMAVLLHFGEVPVTLSVPLPVGAWRCLLDSAATRWGGPGSMVPAETVSPGQASLSLAPHAVVLLSTSGERKT